MTPRARVLMVQPSLQPPGGGNGVAAWILEALKGTCELTVLTWTPLDLEAVNDFYGTALTASDVRGIEASRLAYHAARRLPLSLSFLKRALLLRVARGMQRDFDVLLTANNEADLGRPGIQYVCYPAYWLPRPTVDLRWYHTQLLVDAYYALADRMAGYSSHRMRQNLTLVVSDWTGRMARARHGITTRTVYPPIPTHFRDVPWEQRKNGFLCIGRISPEKNLDGVIDIVREVRRSVPTVTLRLIGSPGPRSYVRQVLARIRAEGDWVTLEQDLSRQALLDLLPHYRYGIHGMHEEHFGMAPAEMVAAGCIVFVPRGGGQVEIVGDDPRLTYQSVEDAVASVTAVLSDPDEQQRLRALLADRRERFAPDRFAEAIRQAVGEFSTRATA